MYRDGSGRTVVDILFSRKREVDGFPWLKGGDEVAVPAKRNGRTGRLSAMLAKSVAVVLKGAAIGLSGLAEGGVTARSVSQSGGPNHVCHWLNDDPVAYLPRGNVTYHLGVLAVAEALARKDEATDLLDAWEELLKAYEASGATCPDISPQVAFSLAVKGGDNHGHQVVAVAEHPGEATAVRTGGAGPGAVPDRVRRRPRPGGGGRPPVPLGLPAGPAPQG